MSRFELCALALCAFLPSCVAAPLDPVGRWNNTYTWTSGSCGLTGSSEFPFSVLKAADGLFLIVNDTPGIVSESGTVSCTDETCRLTLHETAAGTTSGVGWTGSNDAALTLYLDDAIRGSGTFALRYQNGTSCEQRFSSLGSLR